MDDLAGYIHHQISRHLASRPGIKAAEVTAYDPKRHAIKAMLHPEKIETGWMPMGTSHVGGGHGVVIGPTVGDQILIGFLGSNINNPVHLGRLHSDKQQPPVAQSGEIVMKHKTGALIKIDKDGNMTLDVLSKGLTINGNVDFTGGYVKSKGHSIDETHRHKDVTPGLDLTGVPV